MIRSDLVILLFLLVSTVCLFDSQVSHIYSNWNYVKSVTERAFHSNEQFAFPMDFLLEWMETFHWYDLFEELKTLNLTEQCQWQLWSIHIVDLYAFSKSTAHISNNLDLTALSSSLTFYILINTWISISFAPFKRIHFSTKCVTLKCCIHLQSIYLCAKCYLLKWSTKMHVNWKLTLELKVNTQQTVSICDNVFPNIHWINDADVTFGHVI